MSTVTSYDQQRSATEVAADALCLERVKRGIAWLQQMWGDDWVDHIDLEKLSLSSASCCVLGQLYSDQINEDDTTGYDYAYRKYQLKPTVYGFDASRDEERTAGTSGSVTDNYRRLDKIWKQKILDWRRGIRD